METPNASSENVGLDVKPLRTLSPMFPSTYGINSVSQSNAHPFIYISPSEHSSFPPFAAPNQPVHSTPIHATPISNGPRPNLYSNGTPTFYSPSIDLLDEEDEEVLPSAQTSAFGRKIKKPSHLGGYQVGSNSVTDGSTSTPVKTPQKKKPKKVQKIDSGLVPSLLDPRDSVEIVLMTFDALRRRLSQLEDGKEGKNSRPDLTAANTLMTNDLRANRGKRIGSVPGVEIGDIFYFRMELCIVGLHAPSMAGIDYMSAQFNDGDDTVAVSVVSAGGYENEETDTESLIYSGQGGNANIDQKLVRGNLALERSLHRGNTVRVIRSVGDYTTTNGKIYFYDGLYKVQSSWVEKGKSGFNVFKFKLLREPEQSPGLAIWKMTQQWKDIPASRGRMILPDLSSGAENLPVCLVNEVDDEKGPSHFRYSTKVAYLRPLNSMKPLEICRCASVCLPGDVNCTCAKLNDGDLPYSSSGALVSRKPLIYECNASCCCSSNCRNRVTQKGVRIQFEVFKTRDRGWGLRSWDPIRAGTFICEYTGEVINKINLEVDNAEDDHYIFQTIGVDEKAFKWNYGPELLGDPSADYSSENLGPLPIIISARHMGNISRFMNHSCSPNVFWQPILYDHGDEGYPHIMFFAMKHIPPLTELTYDYGMSNGAGSRMTRKCLCGSPKCRGLFG
ncbi:uncharacterized protein A4U43_C08F32340 [Asparagus officinalis]|uniref:histone-lysine N-methyltransferase, H3 lysine-9 specific SUVH3-like n=1 Tax=Asparagus officinalis TaxID=4686 RepID=UPI00098E1763|nr:histone-lysine N-methyltransferase, H3 lysine-9 specific SUVH3-like [Asparagus officinalis]ONK61668.1 uncharacterized protein A4U43_C08F32340 [Asparagus officinalis]